MKKMKKMKMKRKMSNALEAEEKNKNPCIDIFIVLLFFNLRCVGGRYSGYIVFSIVYGEKKYSGSDKIKID